MIHENKVKTDDAAAAFILELKLLIAAAKIAAINIPDTPLGSWLTINHGKMASLVIKLLFNSLGKFLKKTNSAVPKKKKIKVAGILISALIQTPFMACFFDLVTKYL